MRVEFSGWVERDFDEIAEYIAEFSPRHALRFIQRIRAEIRRVGEGPALYRLRPEYGVGARIATVGRYVIMFRVVGDAVWIERVVFGGRDLAAQLGMASGDPR
jgi:toxin ParE1/3/4